MGDKKFHDSGGAHKPIGVLARQLPTFLAIDLEGLDARMKTPQLVVVNTSEGATTNETGIALSYLGNLDLLFETGEQLDVLGTERRFIPASPTSESPCSLPESSMISYKSATRMLQKCIL